MQLFRISKEKNACNLSGTGGLYYDGRWHKLGTKILYFSEHISLAKLEVLANSIIRPKNMVLITINVKQPFSMKHLKLDDLPNSWDGYPYLESVQLLTSNWIEHQESLLLKVPSAQAQYEYNYLMNPLHSEMKNVELISVEPIKFDRRLKF